MGIADIETMAYLCSINILLNVFMGRVEVQRVQPEFSGTWLHENMMTS